MIYEKLNDDYFLRLKALLKTTLETPKVLSLTELGFLCTIAGEQLINFYLMEYMHQNKKDDQEVWKIIEDKPIGEKLKIMKKRSVRPKIESVINSFNKSRIEFIHGFMQNSNEQLQLTVGQLLFLLKELRTDFLLFTKN